MRRTNNLGVRWPDYDEYGEQIPDAPIGRTMTGQPVRRDPELQELREGIKRNNKNAIVLDRRQLSATAPIFNGERIDSDDSWPSTEDDYYQTSYERSRAKNAKLYERTKDPHEKWRMANAMGDEPDPEFDETHQYKLTHVSKDGKTGTLCDLTTGQCIMIALVASVGLAYLTSGGASRKRLKTRAKKTRRHRKK